MDLRGKRVLITGASQGIGAALARAFAAEGCDLVLVARSEEKLALLTTELKRKHSVDVRFYPLDLTQEGSIEALAAKEPEIDVLVNNAGTIPAGNLWDVDAQSWRAGWQLKVFGYIDMTRQYYPLMKERGGGVILNNIGMAAEAFDFEYVAGSSGNAALAAFTKAIGGKSLRDNVRVAGVNPGPVSTERIQKIFKMRSLTQFGDDSHAQELASHLPLGRPATVEEIANLFVFLASKHSGYTSGVVFTVDGGISSAKSII